MIYRTARADDLEAILAISNHYARTTPANFAVEPESIVSWRQSFEETSGKYPWLVAEDERGIVGFAKASPWKGRCAYAYAAETTVYVAPEYHGRGVGKQLYSALLEIMRRQGFHEALGGITLPNDASVRLHESLGFRKCAEFPRIGWKFEKWHNVGYWAAELRPTSETPTSIRPVAEVAGEVLSEGGSY